jgi:hypothetical protein
MVGPIEEAEAKAKTLVGEDEKKAKPDAKADGKTAVKAEAKK